MLRLLPRMGVAPSVSVAPRYQITISKGMCLGDSFPSSKRKRSLEFGVFDEEERDSSHKYFGSAKLFITQHKKPRIFASKQVHFQDNAEFHEIPAKDELTAEEKESCWYTRDALKELKTQAVNDLQQYLNNPNPTFCIRGLERRSKQVSVAFRAQKRRALRAVIAEQWRQRCLLGNVGGTGYRILAQVYKQATCDSQKAAEEQGKVDAHEAAKIHLTVSSVSGALDQTCSLTWKKNWLCDRDRDDFWSLDAAVGYSHSKKFDILSTTIAASLPLAAATAF